MPSNISLTLKPKPLVLVKLSILGLLYLARNNVASFIARTHSNQVKHMTEMFSRAINHKGFSVVEVLSECTMFYKGAFDDGNPRKGGTFEIIEEKTGDGSDEDNNRHDVTSETDAYALADLQYPGKFGVFYQKERPSNPGQAESAIPRSKVPIIASDHGKYSKKRFKAQVKLPKQFYCCDVLCTLRCTNCQNILLIC